VNENASDIVALSMLAAAVHKAIGELRGEGQPPHFSAMAAVDVLLAWEHAAPVLERRVGPKSSAKAKQLAAKIKAGLAA
jgi:hypothetical protein